MASFSMVFAAGMCTLGTLPTHPSTMVSMVSTGQCSQVSVVRNCSGSRIFWQPQVARRRVLKPVSASFQLPNLFDYDDKFNLMKLIWTDDAREALKLAFDMAQHTGHSVCTADHLVVAIGEVAKRPRRNFAAYRLSEFNTILEAAKANLDKMEQNEISVKPEPTEELLSVLEYTLKYITPPQSENETMQRKNLDNLFASIMIHKRRPQYDTFFILKDLAQAQAQPSAADPPVRSLEEADAEEEAGSEEDGPAPTESG